MPVYVVVAQWALLFVLMGLTFGLYRQLALLIGVRASGTERDGLDIGAQAPQLSRGTVGRMKGLHLQDAAGLTLLMMVEPSCASCTQALEMLGRHAEKARDRRVVLITSEDTDQHPHLGATGHEVVQVSRHFLERDFKTHTVPFAYLIDQDHVVLDKAIPTEERAIKRLLFRTPVAKPDGHRASATNFASVVDEGGHRHAR